MSLGDLARVSGVTKGYLSQLERGPEPGGADNPSLETVMRIARGLGVGLAELVHEATPPDPTLPPGLQEFAEEMEADGTPLSRKDIAALLAVRYRKSRSRGRDTADAREWRWLYELLVKIS